MKKNKIHISEERHSQDLESLGSIFMPIMKDAMSAEDFVEADIIWHWRDIIGDELACFTNPVKTKFNPRDNLRTLYIEVPAGGFALELHHREDYILKTVNAYFGYQAVHKLNIAQNINMSLNKKFLPKQTEKEQKLEESEEKYLAELVAEIKDEKLREILVKLGKSVILSKKGVE